MSDTVKKIKRSEFATFLNVKPDGTADYARFGKGVTSQSIAYNPTVNSEQYINEDSATSSVDAYAPTINTPHTAYKGEPIFEYVDGLRRKRAIADDACTDMLMVYIFDKQEDGSYPAEKQNVSISVTDFGGDAGNPLSITYDIGFVGDATEGSVTITDGSVTFTPATTTGS